MHNYKIGEDYNRRQDIHSKYKGNQQAGISTSKNSPFVFLFTGDAGKKFGYSDHWKDGIFHYTGAGRRGDMTFDHYNKPVRDHAQDGRDLLLFKMQGKGKPCQFMGQFSCTGYNIKRIPDEDGSMREGIIFQLRNVDEEVELDDFVYSDIISNSSLTELRDKAYAAVSNTKKSSTSEGKRTYFERNVSIKAYVLSRSEGFCECCGIPAPFKKKDGTPYLEPHHIRKLSDKGMDHPRMIAAITPNCHRKIHYGINGAEIDERLIKIIRDKENAIEAAKHANT